MCFEKRKELDSKIIFETLDTVKVIENTLTEKITYPTFKDWGDMIFDSLYTNYKNDTEKQKGRYRLNKLNEVFGDKLINEINRSDIENWRNNEIK